MMTIQEKQRIRKCAKALYLIGGFADMMTYLDGMVEFCKLTDNEEDLISESVIDSCKDITMSELEELRKRF